MKRILFVAVSATLLAAGCQKTKIINQINPNGEPSLTFTTGMGKLTKVSDDPSDADSVGMANLKAQDFRVWAYGVEDFSRTKEDDREGWDDMLNLPVPKANYHNIRHICNSKAHQFCIIRFLLYLKTTYFKPFQYLYG